jgi:hypothetical protein
MNQQNKNEVLVLIDNLCALSLFPLVTVCFNLRPVTVCYFRASTMGLKIVGWLKTFRVVSKEPIRIDDIYLNDSKENIYVVNMFESLNSCLKNEGRIKNLVDKYLPNYDFYFRQVCAVGVRKKWQLWLQELLLQLNVARVLAHGKGIPTNNVILISQFSFLPNMLNMGSEVFGKIKTYSQPFENKAQQYLWGPVAYGLGQMVVSLFKSWNPFKKEMPILKNKKPMVGVSAAWGFEGGKNLLDDFFWWHKSTVPAEQLVYMFERQDFQPTRDRLVSLAKMGIQSIALDPQYPGDTIRAKDGNQRLSLLNGLKGVFLFSKLALRGLLGDRFARSVCSLVSWQIYKSEKLVPIYKNINLRVIFHFNESGIECVNLATLQSNALRVGVHWSCLSAPNSSSPRCHEVYFVWGAHDLKVVLGSGSVSKNILVSGCFVNEQLNKEEHQEGRKAVQSMKNQGAQFILALFDNSFPVPNFYRFFLAWLVEEPSLGLLIKSKGQGWKNFQNDDTRELVKLAMDTGRLSIMDHSASPVDAALLADFAVGITSISAIVVAALQGARVLYLDYEKSDQGNLAPYSIFHSLGPKRCVFYDLESLKKAVLEYTDNPKSNPWLGDASPILDQLDPFRDGKSSQRIGEYIAWYLENLNQNLSKDEALKAATDKYAEKWGAAKVTRCNS